ncbi:MAG: hypothetical protein ACYTEE_08450, partial [Planctomycetota bacterium]
FALRNALLTKGCSVLRRVKGIYDQLKLPLYAIGITADMPGLKKIPIACAGGALRCSMHPWICFRFG